VLVLQEDGNHVKFDKKPSYNSLSFFMAKHALPEAVYGEKKEVPPLSSLHPVRRVVPVRWSFASSRTPIRHLRLRPRRRSPPHRRRSCKSSSARRHCQLAIPHPFKHASCFF
jgi:hypothetical protein